MYSQNSKLKSCEPFKSYKRAYSCYAEALMLNSALKIEEKVSKKLKQAIEYIADIKRRKATIKEHIEHLVLKKLMTLAFLQEKEGFNCAKSFCSKQKSKIFLFKTKKQNEIKELEKVIEKEGRRVKKLNEIKELCNSYFSSVTSIQQLVL